MTAAAGIVSTHAQTIRPAIPQRTADSRCVAPTPTIDAGDRVRRAHRNAEVRRDAESPIAPPVSAQKPPTGRSLVMRVPIVCTMRQPPNSVPSEIAVYAPISTQCGIVLLSAR